MTFRLPSLASAVFTTACFCAFVAASNVGAAEPEGLTCESTTSAMGPHESWFSVESHKGKLAPMYDRPALAWHPPMTTTKSPLLLGLEYNPDGDRIGALDLVEIYGDLPFDKNPAVRSGWVVLKIDGAEAWRESWKAREMRTLQSDHFLSGSVIVASAGDHQPIVHPERLAVLGNARTVEVQGVAADGNVFADAGYDLSDKKQRDSLFAGIGPRDECK